MKSVREVLRNHSRSGDFFEFREFISLKNFSKTKKSQIMWVIIIGANLPHMRVGGEVIGLVPILSDSLESREHFSS